MAERSKTILIICETHLKSDPRVYKQIKLLKDYAYVVTMGLSPSGLEDRFILFCTEGKKHSPGIFRRILNRVRFKMNPGRYGILFSPEFIENRRSLEQLAVPDVVIANELSSLPYAIELFKEKSFIHFDAHELYLQDAESGARNKNAKNRMEYVYKHYIPKVDTISTVCESIADYYKNEFNKEILILENLPFKESLAPRPVEENNIKVIHHGVALPDRKIELMIEAAAKFQSRFNTTFALIKSPKYAGYYDTLIDLCRDKKNIRLIDGFPMNEISVNLNNYDLGLFFLEPTTKSYEYALPNKFFEFIQGRLAVAVSPNIEMKKYIDKYNLGIYPDQYDIDSMVEIINNLSEEEIMQFKRNSAKAADELCFENRYQVLLNHFNLTNKK